MVYKAWGVGGWEEGGVHEHAKYRSLSAQNLGHSLHEAWFKCRSLSAQSLV